MITNGKLQENQAAGEPSNRMLALALTLGSVYFLLSFLCPTDRLLAGVVEPWADLAISAALAIGAVTVRKDISASHKQEEWVTA